MIESPKDISCLHRLLLHLRLTQQQQLHWCMTVKYTWSIVTSITRSTLHVNKKSLRGNFYKLN